MKKYLFFFLLFSVFLNVEATHIVGGEFQFIERRSGEYDIYLNLYFDEIYGNPQAKDQNFTATIFRKVDNAVMTTVDFQIIAETPIAYTNPDCRIPEVETSRITYAAQNPSTGTSGFQFTQEYNHPEGYYIVWDRCCRNDQIVNIVAPGDAGMLFYLHFPPIFNQNNELTGWSSPAFPPIPATYACVDEPFELDFGATDIDGDSLVFTMNLPLRGNSSATQPIPITVLPEPYPTVTWAAGFNLANQIVGTPSLSVNSSTGMLTVTPQSTGLHVFSVTCHEYRNGVKIGEVNRDFQIFVYNNCQQNLPPSIELSLGDTSLYAEGDTIIVYSSNFNCYDLLITDNEDLRNNEEISIRVVPINFPSGAGMLIAGENRFLGGLGDTLTGWQVCPPNCEYISDEPFIFDIIATDDGCPQPKSNRKRITMILIPEDNSPPILENDYVDSNFIEIEVFEIDTLNISFFGYDVDSTNLLTLEIIPDGFTLDDYGIQFENKSEITPYITSDFEWIINCERLQNTDKRDFKFYITLNDNVCGNSKIDTTELYITINGEQVIENFMAYNIFTPNGDGVNENFVVTGLPRDNCENQYVSFEIYNRWGRKIYESDTRNFSWDGGDVSDGTYYYIARYTNKSYKGHFTIRR